MLKSTHSSLITNKAGQADESSLPSPWTQHRAPTGHIYYYNPETKQSTYTRPAAESTANEELQIDYGATVPDKEVKASIDTLHELNRQSLSHPSAQACASIYGSRRNGASRSNRQGDRPKSKIAIANCAPWFLVTTKYRRRFVHNAETKESFWKFPSHVMMAVIDMDRVQRETDEAKEAAKMIENQQKSSAAPGDGQKQNGANEPAHSYDSDEYEEVEVTDEEEGANTTDQPSTKRQRVETHEDIEPATTAAGPQEFDEDDIAWQLAQMEAEDDDPGYDLNEDDYDHEGDGEGLPLTREDRDALFRALLDDFQISPFSNFDALIDTNTSTAMAIIGDERWSTLPNMSARRSTFDAWSRDRIAARNAPTELTADNSNGSTGEHRTKLEPRVVYLQFLAREATPKLYWPEFKRKFRKAPEMNDRHFPDKDREKLYREYVTILKTSEAERRKSFMALLKSSTAKWDNSPQFYGIRDADQRTELIDLHLNSTSRG